MKYCQNCGSEIQEGSSFCTSCGSKLPENEAVIKDNSESIFGFEDQPTNSNASYNNQSTYQNQTNYQNQNNVATEPQKTNSMCLTGFILSFFFSLIGLIVSCIGLSQVKKNPNEKGQGLAIAGIIIGAIGTVISFIVSIVRVMDIMSQIGA